MASTGLKASGVGIVLFAIFYQWYLKDVLFLSLGVSRAVQPLEDFPAWNCRRIRHERLEACEDMWLDDEKRVLYAACSSSMARTQWNPSMGHLNLTGRRPGGDYISVLNIDEPGDDGLFGLHQMKLVGYDGATGDGTLALVGFDVEVISDSKLKFWMINHRPFVDGNKKLVDPHKIGANSTVEVFDVTRGSDKMVHVQTIASDVIISPNGLAATGDGGFIFSNDHTCKVCLRKEFDLMIGGGTVGYWSPTKSHLAATSGFTMPNGLIKGKDGLYYVPSSFADSVRVMKLQPDLTLKDVDAIRVGMPVDNLSVDKNGDIYAAAFPKILQVLETLKDPYNLHSPSTIFRIHKSSSGYEVEKILEDRESKAIGGATIARHDVKTGRIFIGGAVAPYITVCDPR